MDVFNSEWKQQWETFLKAPYIIASFMVAAWWIGWFLRGIKSERRIDGLESQLKLASGKVELADRAKDEVIRQFSDLKEEVAANAGKGPLAARMATVEAAIENFSAANNAVRSAIGIAVGASSVGASSVTDTISDLYSNTPLVLREEAERIKAEKERLK